MTIHKYGFHFETIYYNPSDHQLISVTAVGAKEVTKSMIDFY